MNKVTITNKPPHTIQANGETVGRMRHRGDHWYAMLCDPRTGEEVQTANHPTYRIASAWARQDLAAWTVEQVIDRYHPKPTLPADEFGPSLKYTLTLRDWPVGGEDGEPEHTTVATCDSRAHMVQAIQRRDDAYKCYVTVWSYEEYTDGDIVEQVNAAEWLEDELMLYA